MTPPCRVRGQSSGTEPRGGRGCKPQGGKTTKNPPASKERQRETILGRTGVYGYSGAAQTPTKMQNLAARQV